MRMAVFSTKRYDADYLMQAAAGTGYELLFQEPRLTAQTARLAEGCDAVCAFVNDLLDAEVLEQLAAMGVRLIALRCAGFNQVDLTAARKLGLCVVRVPAYSPYAVAEHTVGLMLTLNRKFHRAFSRVRDSNFSLDGLLGFDMHGKTVGVIGTGKIGAIVVRLLAGFGCKILAHDIWENPDCIANGASYVSLEQLLRGSDIITLHCPLMPQTHHMIDQQSIAMMKEGVMLINTSRGALVDALAVIAGLKNRRIGYLGLDVYEEEADLFFEDLSGKVIQDDTFMRLLTFPNVVITGHQGFFTHEALEKIAQTTINSITGFLAGEPFAEGVCLTN